MVASGVPHSFTLGHSHYDRAVVRASIIHGIGDISYSPSDSSLLDFTLVSGLFLCISLSHCSIVCGGPTSITSRFVSVVVVCILYPHSVTSTDPVAALLCLHRLWLVSSLECANLA